MGASKATAFKFRRRRDHVNWKRLAGVNVDKVERDVDVVTLQEITTSVTFCDIEAEMEPVEVDPNFVKLFRLSQLIIEYLIYSQECLTHTITSIEQENNKSKMELEEIKHKYKQRLKDEKISFGLMNETIQNKCAYCPKLFMNETYLELHVQRRHIEIQNTFNKTHLKNETIEKELEDLKTQLKATEKHLEEERELNKISRQIEKDEFEKTGLRIRMEMEKWKTEEVANRKRELENLQENYMTEIKNLKDKQAITYKMFDDVHISYEQLKDAPLFSQQVMEKQQHEIEVIKERLRQQVTQVESALCAGIKEQQTQWKLCVEALEKKLTLEKPLEIKSGIQNDVDPFHVTVHQYPDVNIRTSSEIPGVKIDVKQKPKLKFDKKIAILSEKADAENFKQEPVLVKGIRDEISNLLEEKLENIGIPPALPGMSDTDLHRKLSDETRRRENLSGKHKGLLSIREAIRKRVDQVANRKFKASPGNRSIFKRLMGDAKGNIRAVKIPSDSITKLRNSKVSDDLHGSLGAKNENQPLKNDEVMDSTPTPMPRRTLSKRSPSVPDLAASIENILADSLPMGKPVRGVDVLGRTTSHISVAENVMNSTNKQMKSTITNCESSCSSPTSIWDTSISE